MKVNSLANSVKKWQDGSQQTIFRKGSQNISAQKFLSDVSVLVSLWQDDFLNIKNICLAIDDTYLFSCAWLALQHLDKTAVLLPNNKQGTIDSLSKHFDKIIFDKDILFDESVSSDIPLTFANPTTMFFTSGSTSDYQAHERTLMNLETEATAINNKIKSFNLCDIEVCATVSQQHLYGFSWYFFFPLISGYIIQVDRLFAPELVHNRLEQGSVLMITTPVIISHLNGDAISLDNSLVISSASELKQDVAKSFYEKYRAEPLEVYGSTETGVIANRQQLSNSSWQCFDSVKISQDKNSQLEVESSFFKAQKQLMSDIVEIDGNGCFSLLGRVDNVVKVAGKRVSLSAMQTHLNEHSFIVDSACVVQNTYREFVASMLVLSQDGQEQLDRLGKRRFTQQIGAYLLDYYDVVVLPKQWRIVSQIPVNTQGKRVLADILKEFKNDKQLSKS